MKARELVFTLFASLFLNSNISQADEISTHFDQCVKAAAGDGSQIVACQTDETKAQDAELNKTYQYLIRKLRPFPAALLKKSQHAWIKFRDSECEFQSSRVIGGPQGVIAAAQVEFRTNCLLNQTLNRKITLQKYLEQSKHEF